MLKGLKLLKSGPRCLGTKLGQNRSIAKVAGQVALISSTATIVKFGNAVFPETSIIVQHVPSIYVVH